VIPLTSQPEHSLTHACGHTTQTAVMDITQPVSARQEPLDVTVGTPLGDVPPQGKLVVDPLSELGLFGLQSTIVWVISRFTSNRYARGIVCVC
jgi:hypothetical protein